MKLFVILSIYLTSAACQQFNGLLSPPASDASYSSGYGSVVGNNDIASAIKLAEYSNNGISDLSNGGSGVGSSSIASSPVKQLSEKVPIPVPQPYPVSISRPVPVSVPIPNPVNIPRPVAVSVPQPYPVTVPKPVPIPITRTIPVPIQRPLFVSFPQPVQVPIAQPYPVAIPQPTPIRISTPIAVPLPITAGIFGGGNIFSGGIPGGFGNLGNIEGIGKYAGEFGGAIIDGGGFFGAPSGQLVSGGFSGSGSFSNIDSERYGGRSFVGEDQGSGQRYDGNGGYKY